MNFRFFSGSLVTVLCFYHPLVASLKLNPKIVTASLSKNNVHIGSKHSLEGISNSPPAAFLKLRSDPLPQPAQSESKPSSALSFAQQIIVLPALMKITATFMVPCTKACCEFVSLTTENTAEGCTKVFKTISSCVVENARKVPPTAVKSANCVSRMCTSFVRNSIGAIADFSEHVAQGFVDSVRGTKAWTKTFCDIIYYRMLMPAVRNSTDFIANISLDIIAWIEDVALFTFRFVTMVSQDVINFIFNLSLDAADWVTHYSILSYQIAVSAIRVVGMAVFQSVLNIPIWITDVIEVTMEFFSSLLIHTKRIAVQVYNDSLVCIDKLIDLAPFLIRYEEEGQTKIALTPNAQMVLYIISTIYATQSMWEPNVGSK